MYETRLYERLIMDETELIFVIYNLCWTGYYGLLAKSYSMGF